MLFIHNDVINIILKEDFFKSLSLFYKVIFLRVVLGLHQNWEEGTAISHIPPAPHMDNRSHYQQHPPEWDIC